MDIKKTRKVVKDIEKNPWRSVNWNNSFINRTKLPLLCEKSGTTSLLLVGLMAGRQSDKIYSVGRNLVTCNLVT